jgi:putative endonuclease
LYTGITNNLVNRVTEHNRGRGARYTASKRPVRLVYWETVADKGEATKKELKIKEWSRTEKLQFIEKQNQGPSLNAARDKRP